MSRLNVRSGALLLLFLLVVALFVGFVWPTRWRYATEYQQSKLSPQVPIRVRFDRFSGRKQSLFGDDWIDGSVIVD